MFHRAINNRSDCWTALTPDHGMELVVLGGGRLVNTARVAEVVVGEFCHVGDSTSPHFVTDHWLLDSVQHHSVRPFLDYPLT